MLGFLFLYCLCLWVCMVVAPVVLLAVVWVLWLVSDLAICVLLYCLVCLPGFVSSAVGGLFWLLLWLVLVQINSVAVVTLDLLDLLFRLYGLIWFGLIVVYLLVFGLLLVCCFTACLRFVCLVCRLIWLFSF